MKKDASMKKYFHCSAKVAALCVAGLLTAAPVSNSALAAAPVVSLTVEVQGDGWVSGYPGVINCPGDCNGSYKKSSLVTLSANAGADSRFLGWEGACAGAQSSCTLKLRNSTRVTALFEKTTASDPVADPALQESATTTDQTALSDETAAQVIQIGWPAYSVD